MFGKRIALVAVSLLMALLASNVAFASVATTETVAVPKLTIDRPVDCTQIAVPPAIEPPDSLMIVPLAVALKSMPAPSEFKMPP